MDFTALAATYQGGQKNLGAWQIDSNGGNTPRLLDLEAAGNTIIRGGIILIHHMSEEQIGLIHSTSSGPLFFTECFRDVEYQTEYVVVQER